MVAKTHLGQEVSKSASYQDLDLVRTFLRVRLGKVKTDWTN